MSFFQLNLQLGTFIKEMILLTELHRGNLLHKNMIAYINMKTKIYL